MIGIDIVDVTRIERAIERHGDHFLDRVFTAGEKVYARAKRNRAETLAGHFAAKEAFIKAVGRSIPWKDIEVCHREGRPFILFDGNRYENVSISHERMFAVACVYA